MEEMATGREPEEFYRIMKKMIGEDKPLK